MFARTAEWGRLEHFHDGQRPGSRLAVVYGRRRQGKTTLLEAFTQAAGGFYWQALEQPSAQNLREFSQAWNAHGGVSDGPTFPTWSSAIRALFEPSTPPRLVVLDEFGYLLAAAPEVPSLIQAKLTPGARRTGSTQLVLCGSAFSQMKGILSGTSALRGRADLELVIGPFDYRTAAQYWTLTANVDAAFQIHALMGGTPAHLALAGSPPRRGNVEQWMVEHLLDPTSPLFREGRIVVTEDPALSDRALYWGLLSALAEGHRRKIDIGRALGRPVSSLAFPLKVLLRSGWAEEYPDPFHRSRSTMVLTEPIIRAHRLIIEPEERRLVRGDALRVVRDTRQIVARQIHGPHLEWMAAEWAMRFADEASLGGSPRLVGPGVLQYRGSQHQLDLVAVERGSRGGDQIHAIGEAKAGKTAVGVAELARLDDLAGKLGDRAATEVKRLLVARGGFTAELERLAARRGDVELIGLDRLYDGR